MKKIIITIIAVSALTILYFIFFVQPNIDRNWILYQSMTTYDDITYKTVGGETLELDILLPTQFNHDKTPVVFYIHDGEFTDGDKSWLTKDIGENIASAILDAGYAIVSMNYRLLDTETHFPSNIIDVKDSIRYIRSVSEDYSLDPENFGVMGYGSGAYLALFVAYNRTFESSGDSALIQYSSSVNYVIDIAGFTNMSTIRDANTMSGEELSVVQDKLDAYFGAVYDVYTVTDNELNEYDPIQDITVDDKLPTLIIHGMVDAVIPLDQSDQLETDLIAANITYSYYQILGGNHALSNISDAEKDRICGYITTFLNEQYVTN
ncbi:MAG: alpha/beta hydrolase [Bacilli bacterium]|nr:alpha/beta hydrolase [Bacilli bacterium]MBN2876785.1 alpha/beta hydrolase [Bacilli bacterium]